VQVAIDGHAAGGDRDRDAPRQTSKDAIAALRELSVRAVMLTGDRQAMAQRVAAEIGIEEVIAEVLPGDKAGKVTEVQRQGCKVTMAGDGVNDARAMQAWSAGCEVVPCPEISGRVAALCALDGCRAGHAEPPAACAPSRL
jgi:P-type Cu2+ transporter